MDSHTPIQVFIEEETKAQRDKVSLFNFFSIYSHIPVTAY